jgi:hypothetical protein
MDEDQLNPEQKEVPEQTQEPIAEQEQEAQEPKAEEPQQDNAQQPEKDAVDYEADIMAQEVKDHEKGPQGINKVQEAVEEIKKDEIPTVDDLYSQVKKKSAALPDTGIASDDEIDKKIGELVREVKYREEKKEEGDTEKLVEQAKEQAPKEPEGSEETQNQGSEQEPQQ